MSVYGDHADRSLPLMVDFMDSFVEVLRVQDSVGNVETEIEEKAEQH